MKTDVAKKTKYDELVRKVNNINTTDTSDLVKELDYDTKVGGIENKNSWSWSWWMYSTQESIN